MKCVSSGSQELSSGAINPQKMVCMPKWHLTDHFLVSRGKWEWTGEGPGCHSTHPEVNLSVTKSGSLDTEAGAQNQCWGTLVPNDEPEFTEPLHTGYRRWRIKLSTTQGRNPAHLEDNSFYGQLAHFFRETERDRERERERERMCVRWGNEKKVKTRCSAWPLIRYWFQQTGFKRHLGINNGKRNMDKELKEK